MYMSLYDEHSVSSARPTAKTHTHARTPRIYKVSGVIKAKLTLSAASLGTETGTYVSLSLSMHTRAHAHTHAHAHAHAYTHTHAQTHTHAHERAKILISSLLLAPLYVRHVVNQIDVCDVISLCKNRAVLI